jgi:hypothetical protein
MTTQSLSPATITSSRRHEPAAATGKSVRSPRARDQHRGTVEFRLIFAAAFVVFLLTSALERAFPTRWTSQNADTGARKSVIERAKESASIVAGYAFQG